MSQHFWSALGDWWTGVTQVTYGSCSGDPIAAEKQAVESHRAQAAESPSSSGPSAPALPVQSATKHRTLLTLFVLLSFSSLLMAQRRFRFSENREPEALNRPYDGRFTFARLKYTTAPGGYWYQGMPSWAHGYPMSEDNLMRIMNEVSYLGARTDAYDLFSLDDPELMKYPVAYITEAGWWTLTDQEAAAFRAYLQKGGFVIFDDFKVPGDFGAGGGGWDTFEANMKRVIPGAAFVDMDATHPIFHCFFEIDSLDHFPQAYNAGRPIFRGLYEDNDPRKRLQMIINYNTDISQYWEWSGRGFRPFDETNEAYKLGVNYVIYGLTH